MPECAPTFHNLRLSISSICGPQTIESAFAAWARNGPTEGASRTATALALVVAKACAPVRDVSAQSASVGFSGAPEGHPTLAANQGSGVAIADQRVVFDWTAAPLHVARIVGPTDSKSTRNHDLAAS